MERETFERLVEEGYEQLPEWVRKKIENVAILVEDEPSQKDRKEEGLADNETLLGLYKGVPLSARGDFYGVGMTLPDTITLYQLPIEDEAQYLSAHEHISFEEAVKKVVGETVWHEVAHHFGMDEHAVRLREEERDIDIE